MTLEYSELQRRHDLLKDQVNAYRSVLSDIAAMAKKRGGKDSLMSAMARTALDMEPAELRHMHREIAGDRLAKVCARYVLKYIKGSTTRGEVTALKDALARHTATRDRIRGESG